MQKEGVETSLIRDKELMNERMGFDRISRALAAHSKKKIIILGPFILCGHLLPCHFQGEGVMDGM